MPPTKLYKIVMRILKTTRVGLLGVLVACAGGASATKTSPKQEADTIKSLWVKHHLVPCDGWAGQNYCYAVSEKPQGPWSVAKDGLENFFYQWGYSYRLLVTGGSGSGQRVVKIQRKVPVSLGTEFDFSVEPKRQQTGLQSLLAFNDGVGQILMGPSFTCDSPPVCDEIERRLRQERSFVVRFIYGVGGVRAVAVNDAAAATTASAKTTAEARPPTSVVAASKSSNAILASTTATALEVEVSLTRSATVATVLGATATASVTPAMLTTSASTVSATKAEVEAQRRKAVEQTDPQP